MQTWRAFNVLAMTLIAIVGLAPNAWAEPTNVTVRVISKGAKFIGTSMGVLVTLRDAETGELLARGTTVGGTGDTDGIMKQERRRGGIPLATDDAAKFSATLELDEPRLVEVSAFGPLAQRQSANRVSAVQWLVPGRHVTGGDGWLLEMPGFVVDVLAPPAHKMLKGVPQTIGLEANVTLMCGCPIEPGGLWDANRYEVSALIRRNGEPAGQIPLAYAGKTSQFAGSLPVDAPGVYEATVYAYDASNGNTGLDKVTFIVAPK